MPMVHMLHNEYQVIMRHMILNSHDPATLIHVFLLLPHPLKLQYTMTIFYPIALSYVLPTILLYSLLIVLIFVPSVLTFGNV
jgi:hypothetical protein